MSRLLHNYFEGTEVLSESIDIASLQSKKHKVKNKPTIKGYIKAQKVIGNLFEK